MSGKLELIVIVVVVLAVLMFFVLKKKQPFFNLFRKPFSDKKVFEYKYTVLDKYIEVIVDESNKQTTMHTVKLLSNSGETIFVNLSKEDYDKAFIRGRVKFIQSLYYDEKGECIKKNTVTLT